MSILFLGPLPPPVHGFSVINEAMLGRMRERTEVSVLNASAVKGPLALIALVRLLAKALTARGATTLYVGLSGGGRQIIDLAFLAIARCRGIEIVVHHHSFSYLNRRRKLTALLLKTVPRALHVCLCECMRAQLIRTYPGSASRSIVISNAAFLPLGEAQRSRNQNGGLTIGFLSNITPEKGIFEFLEVLEAARVRGLPWKGLVAGGGKTELMAQVESTVRTSGNIDLIGPVYGDRKEQFFDRIDVLLFPTRYENEAEPVTILEAMSRGIPVVAFSRGCIDDLLQVETGSAVKYSKQGFVDDAIRRIEGLSTDLDNARQQVLEQFTSLKSRASLSLAGLLEPLCR